MSLIKFKDPDKLPIERIVAYLKSDEENDSEIVEALSTKDREILDQVNFVDDQIRKFRRPSKTIVAMMRKKFINPRTEKPISVDTCYRRIRQCQQVFATTYGIEKDYWTNILLDVQLRNIQRAEDNNDVRGVNAAVGIIKDLLQLNKSDADLIPEDALERITVIHVTDPSIGGFDVVPDDQINKLYSEITGETALPYMNHVQDVDFEDLTDEDD